MRKFYLLLLLLLLASSAQAFTLSDFESPESVVTDPEDGSYYVSNINGDPFLKDGNGYISKISSNGNTVTQKYIGGTKESLLLDAPKGLTIIGKNIFAADIDTVKVFDKETRKQVKIVDFVGFAPKFLNDMTADREGNMVYVSDMLADCIYRIDVKNDYRVSVFKEGAELGQPNGLAFNPKTKNLMAVGFSSGEILEITMSGKVHILKKGLKGLDGIDYDSDGNLYVSNHEKGEIYQIGRLGRGPLTTYLSNLTTPADISYDRQRGQILIPSMQGNTVSAVSKESSKQT